jgi:hypothetical protein
VREGYLQEPTRVLGAARHRFDVAVRFGYSNWMESIIAWISCWTAGVDPSYVSASIQKWPPPSRSAIQTWFVWPRVVAQR